ncbi:hypothetical protein AKO1_003890 [Acrasis kona]|uniref:Tim44-like domain-containing protein n=1 Tax=Acrasis kona TaxID=1008807 RepID=A0AAW2ZG55_9EUKA
MLSLVNRLHRFSVQNIHKLPPIVRPCLLLKRNYTTERYRGRPPPNMQGGLVGKRGKHPGASPTYMKDIADPIIPGVHLPKYSLQWFKSIWSVLKRAYYTSRAMSKLKSYQKGFSKKALEEKAQELYQEVYKSMNNKDALNNLRRICAEPSAIKQRFDEIHNGQDTTLLKVHDAKLINALAVEISELKRSFIQVSCEVKSDLKEGNQVKKDHSEYIVLECSLDSSVRYFFWNHSTNICRR